MCVNVIGEDDREVCVCVRIIIIKGLEELQLFVNRFKLLTNVREA